MKKGWEYKTLGEIAQIKGGKRVPKGYKLISTQTNYPYIRVSDFNDNGSVNLNDIQYITEDIYRQIENYTICDRDLYISIAGTIGKAGIIPSNLNGANLTENACKLVFKEGVDNRYIYYFTQSIDFLVQAGLNTRTTAMPKLALNRLATIGLKIPQLNEQKRIVAILDQCFEAIDKAMANVERNLQNAKDLFQSQLNQIFSQKGEGWVEKKLGEVSDIIYGYTAKAKHEPATAKLLRITDIQNNNVNWDSVPYCDLDEIELNKYRLKLGDIVFARTGATTGKSFIIKNPPQAVFASYLIRVQINNEELNPDLLYLFFQSSYYWYLINKGISGSAQGGFNASKLKELVISFPESAEMQIRYIQEMDELKAQTQSLESHYQQELDALDELKKSILQKAFNGEL